MRSNPAAHPEPFPMSKGRSRSLSRDGQVVYGLLHQAAQIPKWRSPPTRGMKKPEDISDPRYIRDVVLLRKEVPSFDSYPFNLPAIRHLNSLALHSGVTFLVGENGSGK